VNVPANLFENHQWRPRTERRRHAHFARDEAHDFQVRLGAHRVDGARQPLHFA